MTGASFADFFDSVDPALYLFGEGMAMWLGDNIDDEVRILFNEWMLSVGVRTPLDDSPVIPDPWANPAF